jgi:hypothetical protein
VTRGLVDPGHLEVSEREEFMQDVESILREYLRKDREITERAKDDLEARGAPYSELYKAKRQLAEQQDFGIGEDAVNWITTQLMELFMRSQFVEEIFVEDAVIRRTLREVLKRNMQADADLDREVRRRLKHLEDGTSMFEVEYQRQLEEIRRKHGLE